MIDPGAPCQPLKIGTNGYAVVDLGTLAQTDLTFEVCLWRDPLDTMGLHEVIGLYSGESAPTPSANTPVAYVSLWDSYVYAYAVDTPPNTRVSASYYRSPGRWVTLSVVVKGGATKSLEFFMDGVSMGSATPGSAFTLGDKHLWLMVGSLTAAANVLEMLEVRLWGKALTQAEIDGLKGRKLTGDERASADLLYYKSPLRQVTTGDTAAVMDPEVGTNVLTPHNAVTFDPNNVPSWAIVDVVAPEPATIALEAAYGTSFYITRIPAGSDYLTKSPDVVNTTAPARSLDVKALSGETWTSITGYPKTLASGDLEHVAVTGLTASTDYRVYVSYTDDAGNVTWANAPTGYLAVTTTGSEDTTPPVVGTLTLTTAKAASASFAYGETTDSETGASGVASLYLEAILDTNPPLDLTDSTAVAAAFAAPVKRTLITSSAAPHPSSVPEGTTTLTGLLEDTNYIARLYAVDGNDNAAGGTPIRFSTIQANLNAATSTVTITPLLLSAGVTYAIPASMVVPGDPTKQDEPYRVEVEWRPYDPGDTTPWKAALPLKRVQGYYFNEGRDYVDQSNGESWKGAFDFDNIDTRMRTVVRGLSEGETYDFRVRVYTDAETSAIDTQGHFTTRTDDVPCLATGGTRVLLSPGDDIAAKVAAALGTGSTVANGDIQFASGEYRFTPGPGKLDMVNYSAVLPMNWSGAADGYLTVRGTPTEDGVGTVLNAADADYDSTAAGRGGVKRWTRAKVGADPDTVDTAQYLDATWHIYRSRTPYPREIQNVWYEPLDRPADPTAARAPSSMFTAGNDLDIPAVPEAIKLICVNEYQSVGATGPLASPTYGDLMPSKGFSEMPCRADVGQPCFMQDAAGYIYVWLRDIDPDTVKMKVPTRARFTKMTGQAYIVIEDLTLKFFDAKNYDDHLTGSENSAVIEWSSSHDIIVRRLNVDCWAGNIFGPDSTDTRRVVIRDCIGVDAGVWPDNTLSHDRQAYWWHSMKTSSQERNCIYGRISELSFLGNKILGPFNGIAPWAFDFSNGHKVDYENAFWEVSGNDFEYILDDAVEPDGNSSGFMVEDNRFYRCYTGISLCPLNLGPFWAIRNKWYADDFFFGVGTPTWWKMGYSNEPMPRDYGFKGFYNNDIIAKGNWDGTGQDAHPVGVRTSESDAWYASKTTLAAMWASGKVGNFEFINNYVHADHMYVGQRGMQYYHYPYKFDYNFVALRCPGNPFPKAWNTASGIPHLQNRYADYFLEEKIAATGHGIIFEDDSGANWRTYPTWADWTAGKAHNTDITILAIGPPARQSNGDPATKTVHMLASGFAAPLDYTFTYDWLHDPHSLYRGNDWTDYKAGAASGDFAITSTFPGIGVAKHIPNVTYDTGRTTTWECPIGVAPTAGAVEYNVASGTSDTTPPTAGVFAVTGQSSASVTVAIGAGTDDVGVTGRTLRLYSDSGRTVQVGPTHTILAGIGALTVTGLAPNTTYYLRATWGDAAGNTATADATATTEPVVTPADPPPTPGTVTVSARTANSLTVAFSAGSDNTGVTAISVRPYTDAACASPAGPVIYPTFGTAGGTVTVTGLAANTGYWLRVLWYDAAGNASAPVTAQGTTLAATEPPPPPPPPPPVVLTPPVAGTVAVIARTTDGLTVSVGASPTSGVASVQLAVFSDAARTQEVRSAYSLPVSGGTVSVASLTSGRTYYFRAVWTNAGGLSAWADASGATTGGSPIGTVGERKRPRKTRTFDDSPYPRPRRVYGTWTATPTLADLRKSAKHLAGVPEDNDPYSDLWDGWVNEARDEVIADLAFLGDATASVEIVMIPTASGLYDCAPRGFLRVDRVGIVDAAAPGAVRWLPWTNLSAAFADLTERNGDPLCVYAAGGAGFGLAPVPTDGTVRIVVQGVAIPRPMLNDADASQMGRDALRAIGLKAALAACEYDSGDARFREKIPRLSALYAGILRELRFRRLQQTAQTGGMATAYGVTEGDAMAFSRQQAVFLTQPTTPPTPTAPPPGGTPAKPDLKFVTASAVSTSGLETVVIPLSVPVATAGLDGVYVRSVDQGECDAYVVSGDGLTITATLRSGLTFLGETVKATYLAED